MAWEKLKPIKGGFGGCLHCGYQYDVAPMDMLIAVGFGMAAVKKDGKYIYNEMDLADDAPETEYWTTQDAENEALKDPDHDWRIILDAPLSMREYQRQDTGKWVLVKKGRGFA